MNGAKGASKARQRGRFCNRFPKVLLEQSGLTDEVELEVKDRQIIIRTAHKPRRDWENRFQAMAENGDDELLDKNELPFQSSWDEKEWSW